jgi:hypothetical protein
MRSARAGLIAGGGLSLLVVGVAAAHGIGASQLRLRVDGARVDGAWDVQLRDARRAVDLDPAIAGEPGWGELRSRESALRAYFGGRLSLAADGAACATEIADAPLDWLLEGQQITLHFRSSCAGPPQRLVVACDLLFDRDPRHRVYYSIEDARGDHAGLFRADRRAITVDVRQFRAGADFAEFVRDGIAHIWTGLDHLLFLLALLLPAPLARAGESWSPRPGVAATAREVVKVVTAFTLAHSLTLALAFFGVLAPNPRWVEAAIAASVLAAAWNNLRPFLPGRAWAMALAFGLVHGLGFAGALRNLALPIHARALALVAFNVGVELGQLAIVAALLPLLHAAGRRRFYPRAVMGFGSFAIAWVAALWILERAFGLPVGLSIAGA